MAFVYMHIFSLTFCVLIYESFIIDCYPAGEGGGDLISVAYCLFFSFLIENNSIFGYVVDIICLTTLLLNVLV